MDPIQQLFAEATAMTALEIAAVITAVIYVLLASMERIACWFFGIVSSALFTYIFYSVNYQLEAILNVFYVVMGFYGWYVWTRKDANATDVMHIVSFDLKQIGFIVLSGTVLSLIAGYLFDVYLESSRPYLDALTTIFAMITTWMVARKILENWLFWIVIDALSIYLYVHKELYFTSFLYIIYIIIAVRGFISWRRTYISYSN